MRSNWRNVLRTVCSSSRLDFQTTRYLNSAPCSERLGNKIYDVIVVGAGPTGLTLSSLLSRFGLSVAVLERNSGLTDHPQAHFINHRTMEVFRPLHSLSQEVSQTAPPLDTWRKFVYCESVSGRKFGEVDHFREQTSPLQQHLSPEPLAHLSQHRLVPLIHNRVAKSTSVDVFFGCEVADMYETDAGVGVRFSKGGSNGTNKMEGQYAVVAAGANTGLRTKVGITVPESPAMQYLMNVHFESPDLAASMANNPAMLYFVFNEQAIAVFVVHDLERGEFVAQLPYFPPLQSPADFSPAVCRALIDAAAGGECKDIDVKSVRPWIMKTQVADSFRKGRVFVAGDSAHVFPPAGGFGMNTGVQDAHNLAWKLAAVIKGVRGWQPGTGLLDTYHEERRPVAQANADLSVNNWKEATKVPAVLGLDPSAATILNNMTSKVFGSVLPTQAAKNVLEFGLALGRKAAGLRGPLAKWRERRLAEIFDSGETLRLQYPKEDLGFQYVGSGFVSEGDLESLNSRSGGRHARFVPMIGTGCRLPHCLLRLEKSGDVVSSLDLVSHANLHAVLFLGKQNGCPAFGAAQLLRKQGLPVKVVRISAKTSSEIACPSQYVPYVETAKDWDVVEAADCFGEWARLCNGPDVAVLVRPDGHVCWKASEQDKRQEQWIFSLRHALGVLYQVK